MSIEAVSRATAYMSCLWCLSLFATTMSLAVINVGKFNAPHACYSSACVAVTTQMPKAGTQVASIAAPF